MWNLTELKLCGFCSMLYTNISNTALRESRAWDGVMVSMSSGTVAPPFPPLLPMSFTSVASELTLVAGLGEVLSSGTSALLGIFRPPYFFQYIQQETQRRHCMFGGPHEYHWADCMSVDAQNAWLKIRSGSKTLSILISTLTVLSLSLTMSSMSIYQTRSQSCPRWTDKFSTLSDFNICAVSVRTHLLVVRTQINIYSRVFVAHPFCFLLNHVCF